MYAKSTIITSSPERARVANCDLYACHGLPAIKETLYFFSPCYNFNYNVHTLYCSRITNFFFFFFRLSFLAREADLQATSQVRSIRARARASERENIKRGLLLFVIHRDTYMRQYGVAGRIHHKKIPDKWCNAAKHLTLIFATESLRERTSELGSAELCQPVAAHTGPIAGQDSSKI